MKRPLQVLLLAMTVFSVNSCGIPTAAVRTYKNSLAEISEITNGTSSAYKDVR